MEVVAFIPFIASDPLDLLISFTLKYIDDPRKERKEMRTSHRLLRQLAFLVTLLRVGRVASAFLTPPVVVPVRSMAKGYKQEFSKTIRSQPLTLLDLKDKKVEESVEVLPETDIMSSRKDVQQARNPEVTDMMRALGTSPRRVALSFLSASGIALAGNFLGVTSTLLTAIPEETVEASGLDTYFPRGDFKRCRAQGYTFVIPREWVADTFIELAKAQRNVQPLDLQMKRRSSSGGSGTLPDSAYGPPGRLNKKGVSESGDTNVSVIVTSGLQGFSLRRTLGEPKEAAEKLLHLSIAPEGSGREAVLLSAIEDTSRGVYQFEFNVDRGAKGPPVKNISVVAASPRGDELITLTVVAPLKQWGDKPLDTQLRKIASSFHLTS